ncbi:unnamed protein product [Echinostoma caproni]|uniref:Peptidase_M16 domain-containing protein n=1 Tax=Echinostoma caproni TaxID=27848 RepID=A0A183AB52_9TREM|nr:unnamed protein product [Echinostoma caproni]
MLYVVLENGLKAVLVSRAAAKHEENNNTTDKTAWAITIPLGSFTDPKEADGLSDLIRRTLVQELLQEQWINQNQTDAYTSGEWTTFYCEVEPKRFNASLDQFTTHLLNPKFEMEQIEAQLKLIEQDFKRSKLKDEVVLRHFISNLANSDSPFCNAKKGSVQTLQNGSGKTLSQLRSKMLDHLASCLDPKEMTFAVESSTVIPVREKEQLRMIWSLENLQQYYRCNPMLVLGSLIKNLQEGGVAYHLEENENTAMHNVVLRKRPGEGHICFVYTMDFSMKLTQQIFNVVKVSNRVLTLEAIAKTTEDRYSQQACKDELCYTVCILKLRNGLISCLVIEWVVCLRSTCEVPGSIPK